MRSMQVRSVASTSLRALRLADLRRAGVKTHGRGRSELRSCKRAFSALVFLLSLFCVSFSSGMTYGVVTLSDANGRRRDPIVLLPSDWRYGPCRRRSRLSPFPSDAPSTHRSARALFGRRNAWRRLVAPSYLAHKHSSSLTEATAPYALATTFKEPSPSAPLK